MKQCTKCKEIKPHSEFHKAKDRLDGFLEQCKKCKAEYKYLYYRKNKKRILEKQKLDRKNNQEKYRIKDRIKYKKHRKWILDYQKKYREKHKKEVLEYAKIYRERNRKIVNEKIRKWRKTLQGKEVLKRICYKKRVIKNGAKLIGDHTFKEWENLKKKCNYMCLCCKQQEPKITLTEDHIIPLSKGGSNGIKNIQPLCAICNSKKHTKIIKYEMVGSN